MKAIRKYLLSLDTIVALVLSIVGCLVLPRWVDVGQCKDIFNIGISVLSIVFSIFFASLAFIISSSDDEFVLFMEQNSGFTTLINTFKITLWSLFIALIYSLVMYSIATFKIVDELFYHCSVVCSFIFVFFYSLTATMMSTKDSIRYAQKRAQFVLIQRSANLLPVDEVPNEAPNP